MTRDRLVSEALALVDEDGGAALSMRSLARRVDRQVSSLYNHVSSRGDLIEALRARIVDDIDTASFRTERWDAALSTWARSYLAAFAAHPNIIQLLATTPIRDDSTLDMYDDVVSALLDAGWAVRDAVAVMRTVEALVLGSALDVVAPSDLLSQSSVPPAHASLHAALDPSLHDDFSARRAFEVGLGSLMAGLRESHATRIDG